MAYIGMGGSVGAGAETTYGTAVSRAVWIDALSLDGSRDPSRASLPVLHLGGGQVSRRHVDGQEVASVRWRGVGGYTGWGMFLKQIMGSLATTGSGPYVNTYTLATALPTGLTIELIRGTAANSEVFEGVKLNRMSASISAGGVLEYDMEGLAETAATRGTAGTPSGITFNPIHSHHAGTFGFNSVNYTVNSLDFTVDNALSRRDQL